MLKKTSLTLGLLAFCVTGFATATTTMGGTLVKKVAITAPQVNTSMASSKITDGHIIAPISIGYDAAKIKTDNNSNSVSMLLSNPENTGFSVSYQGTPDGGIAANNIVSIDTSKFIASLSNFINQNKSAPTTTNSKNHSAWMLVSGISGEDGKDQAIFIKIANMEIKGNQVAITGHMANHTFGTTLTNDGQLTLANPRATFFTPSGMDLGML